MNGTPQTTTTRSISLYGLSDVILTFHNGTDNYFARQQVFNRLPDISLPSGVTPSVSPLSAPSGLIYRYVLQSPDRSPMELKTLEAWTIEPHYKSIPGVADEFRLWRGLPLRVSSAARSGQDRCGRLVGAAGGNRSDG